MEECCAITLISFIPATAGLKEKNDVGLYIPKRPKQFCSSRPAFLKNFEKPGAPLLLGCSERPRQLHPDLETFCRLLRELERRKGMLTHLIELPTDQHQGLLSQGRVLSTQHSRQMVAIEICHLLHFRAENQRFRLPQLTHDGL